MGGEAGAPVQEACRKCGSCCSKGGPTLRYEDEHLVKLGKIASKNLYTMRKGELAYDHRKKKLVPLQEDNIKIKVCGDSMECVLLDKENSCTVYTMRPSECRSYKCWSLREVEMKYSQPPLTRKDLLGGVEGLWELIETHEERCSQVELAALVEALKGGDEKALAGIEEIISFDKSIRATLTDKGSVDPEMLDFMLGRPVTKTIVMFGMEVKEGEKGLSLSSIEGA